MSSPTTPTEAIRTRARWSMRRPAPPAEVARLMKELGIGPVMASVLWSRGIRDDVSAHLTPVLQRTDISTLDAAAERLERAIRTRQRVLIHGDYDADGISGTAVMLLGLRELGADVDAFIPDRLTDGYGIHGDRVDEHAERADLFVTVDCGISNLEEIGRLRSKGVDVIVTDHHTPGHALPDCLVVHPSHAPTAAPGKPELTGAGVAFHLLWALRSRLGLEAPLEYADLATLGTIADVAPLLGENRALIREGLQRMRDSHWPGVRAAVAQSSLRGDITARDVAFVLAPRLNAAGRLGEADKGLELLVTASERRARELAAYLDARNEDRRRIQDDMFESAMQRIDPHAPAIVVGDDAWHPGVMGIVASKILERVYRPVFIHAKGKGSVRSTPGISAVAALRAAAPHLERFGGHAQAAGFAIEPGSIAGFRTAVTEFVAGHPTPEPTLVADAFLTSGDIDDGLLRAVRDLEPFGEGHASPRFALSGSLDQARAVGRDGATLQLRIGGVKGVAWQLGDLAPSLPRGRRVAAMVELRENEWNGKRAIEFLAEDVRPTAPIGFADVPASQDRPPFRRGSPDGSSARRVDTWTDVSAQPGTALVLGRLLLAEDAFAPTRTLERLVQSGTPLYFDLDDDALLAVEQRLDRYPTIHDVRRAFVCKQRSSALPFGDAKNASLETILRELDLVDPLGRARRGVRREPLSSDTLLRGLVERYKLRTFVDGFRMLDEDAFAIMVETIFGAG